MNFSNPTKKTNSGLSSKWYRHIFPTIHDQQLKRLASSFTIIPMNGTRISEV